MLHILSTVRDQPQEVHEQLREFGADGVPRRVQRIRRFERVFVVLHTSNYTKKAVKTLCAFTVFFVARTSFCGSPCCQQGAVRGLGG